ncbi:MAG: murein transglycosylase A [Desulfobacteraceae bacterium]|nr:murein transglycosylase A [Desulfobacteraceae bacterium]
MPCKNPSWLSRGRWRQPAFNFNRVLFVVVAAALLSVACASITSCAHKHKKQTAAPRPLLERLEPQDIPALSDIKGDEASLKKSIKEALTALSRQDQKQAVAFGNKTIDMRRIKETLQTFLQLLDEDLTPRAFHDKLVKEFDFYRVNARRGNGTEGPPMLITGYFQPELPASLSPDSHFNYPVYAVPNDLVGVNLKTFDPNLPNMTIWGRVSANRLIPYYTRREIDSGEGPKNTPVLAWIDSPIDGLMLHIQGSGILKFQNGGRRFIHYAASNGLPYKSVGAWLIEHGFLGKDQADWGHIRAWADKNPERLKDALASNPRYIFFEWEDEGPLGSLGETLIPFRSVALDPTFYPPGAVCLVKFDMPAGIGHDTTGPFEAFVCNQDAGAAIKGPYRLDLYCGEGDKAGKIAGTLKAPGWFYLMLVKESK